MKTLSPAGLPRRFDPFRVLAERPLAEAFEHAALDTAPAAGLVHRLPCTPDVLHVRGVEQPDVVEQRAGKQKIYPAVEPQGRNHAEEGKPARIIVKMNAFIDKVKAQRGKKINEDDADLLIARAEEIIKLIEDGLGN